MSLDLAFYVAASCLLGVLVGGASVYWWMRGRNDKSLVIAVEALHEIYSRACQAQSEEDDLYLYRFAGEAKDIALSAARQLDKNEKRGVGLALPASRPTHAHKRRR